jgi:nitrogen fixation-related uncharacterized protein
VLSMMIPAIIVVVIVIVALLIYIASKDQGK